MLLFFFSWQIFDYFLFHKAHQNNLKSCTTCHGFYGLKGFFGSKTRTKDLERGRIVVLQLSIGIRILCS